MAAKKSAKKPKGSRDRKSPKVANLPPKPLGGEDARRVKGGMVNSSKIAY
jgi:hypothetical protein